MRDTSSYLFESRECLNLMTLLDLDARCDDEL